MDCSIPVSELPPAVRLAVTAAAEARNMAYAPYSEFYVGAALLTSGEQKIVTGCNVENASYGLAICAERAAVVKAVSMGYRDFRGIVIIASNPTGCVVPCGACRQVLCEFNPALPIYCVNGDSSKVKVTTLHKLLPDCFSPKYLNMDSEKENVKNN